MGWVDDLLDELEVGADARRQIWGGTAAAWLGLDAGERAGHDPAPRAAPAAMTASGDAVDRGTDGALAEAGDESTGRRLRLRNICC